MKIQSGFFYALLLVAVVSGCASPSYNYKTEVTEISIPPLGIVQVANIGEELLKQGRYMQRDAIKITAPIDIGLLNYYTIQPGFYVKVGENESSEFYLPDTGRNAGRITKGALVDPPLSVQLNKDDSQIYVISIYHSQVGSKPHDISRTKRMVVSDDSFQQTLIYSGKVGAKIKLGYREFSNNLARPAFNNDVDYDLNESKIIGYKGAQIEILEANNNFIRYKVLSNFKKLNN